MVDKKRKKSKSKTKKRISREMIKIVVNNYLNNRDLRKRKRRQAQQKRNPQNRLGGTYPLQNKAIDAISYSNQFRHTNDTRLMALERGMSNALTANISMLNSVIRHNKNLPLIDNKPHLPDPSLEYKLRNPNYPDPDTLSVISGTSIDADDLDEIGELERGLNIDNKPLPPPPRLKTISEDLPEPLVINPPAPKKDVDDPIEQPDPLTRAASEEVEKDLQKEKTTKKIRVKKQPPSEVESPSQKDYGARPSQQSLFSFMTENQIIDKAKFYDLPQSEINKFTTTNRDGETIIKTGKKRAFKEAILKRAREVTKPSVRGRPFGS